MSSAPARPHSEQTALIAGGTSGIGLASALALAAAGVRRIALVGRDRERGAATVATVSGRCPETDVEFFAGDMTDPSEVERVLTLAHGRWGSLDVVVGATAAERRPELMHRQSLDEVRDAFLEASLPPLLLTRAAYPYLSARGGGVVVNIASDAAKVPTPGEGPIGAAMSAIVMLTRVAALEGKRVGIRVNAITPSLVLGTRTSERILADGFSKRLFEKAAEQAHLGVVEPEDVASLVVFLTGPAAAKITGQAISVNGGIST